MAQSKVASTTRKMIFHRDDTSIDANANPEYVDIAKELSKLNRRSYRQAMNYAVENIKITKGTNPAGTYILLGVPKLWTVDNATTKIYNLWMEQRREVLKLNPDLKAKWSDFKVFLDTQHKAAWLQNNLRQTYIDVDGNGQHVPDGEWDPSKLTFPEISHGTGPTNVPMHIVGDNIPAGDLSHNTDSIGIVHEYMNTKSKVLTPDPTPMVTDPEDGLYNLMASHDQISETSLQNVMEHNDQPPYNRDVMAGDGSFPILDILAYARFNDYGNTNPTYTEFNTGPLVVPFGLIKFLWVPDEPHLVNPAPTIEITVAPGKYKGVLAERGV